MAIDGLVPGEYVLAVEPVGAVPRRVPVRVLPQPTTEVRVEVERGARLALQVVDGDGAPVEGAMVSLDVEAGPSGMEQDLHATTDAAGRAALDGIQEGSARLGVRHDHFMPYERVDPTSGTEPFVCILTPRPRLRFTLQLDGVPARQEYVWVTERSAGLSVDRTARRVAGGASEHAVWSVDEEATFVLRPWEGARVLLARRSLAAGEVLDLGKVRVDRGREIAGQVVDARGLGVAGVQVLATIPGLDDTAPVLDRSAPSATTDAQGRFVVRGVHRTAAILRTQHATWAPARASHADGEPAPRLVVLPGAWLVVTLAHEGWLELEGPDGVARLASPDPGVPLRLGPLPPGEHRARVHRAGQEEPVSERRLTLAAGEDARLDG